MFSIFKKKAQPEPVAPQPMITENGLFGYYKLMDWYMNDFTDEERERFKVAYGSAGMGLSFERLISGYESPLSQQDRNLGPVHLLTSILGKIIFNDRNQVDLVEKIISKIDSLINDETDVLEKHFAYLQEIDFYKGKANQGERFVQSCLHMISIAEQARKAFEERYNSVPNHSAFFYLLDYYESKKMFDKAKWVADESESVWGRSMDVDYESWLDDLIEKNNAEEAKRVLALADEAYGDEDELSDYRERIEGMKA